MALPKRVRIVGVTCALVAPVLLSACGTRVGLSAQTAIGPSGTLGNSGFSAGQGADGTSVGESPTASGSVGFGGVEASAAGSGTTTDFAAPAGSESQSSGSTGSVSGPAAAGAPGVTATTITLGFPYTVNGAAANSAIGGAGISQGDEKADYQILIDDINAHGGVLGRKIVPVFHAIDALGGETTPQIVQAMCADFTQDHHVFAAFAGGDDSFNECMQKAGAFNIYDNLSVSDQTVFQRYKYYVEISLFNLDRVARNEVKALVAQKYFTPWSAAAGAPATGTPTKVGVITYDDPAFTGSTKRSLLPALKAAGYPATDVIYVHTPQSTQELSQVAQEVSSAIVKFRSDGVEHVLIMDATATLTLVFLNGAESQHYRPRYGFNTQNGAGILLDASDAPAAQFIGSLGMGWYPNLDLRAADNPDNGPYSNPSRKACIALMKAHGQSFADANAEAVALLYCNQLYFFRAALTKGGSAISRESWLQGVNATKGNFESTMTFKTYFGPDKHDGAAAYRYYGYAASCGCMRYNSGIIDAA